jgi:uncharacterized membrane protein
VTIKCSSRNRVFLYTNESMADPGTLGGNGSCAFAVNAGGQVAGTPYVGTYDQGGDVSQWNEAKIGDSSHGLLGSSWIDFKAQFLASSARGNADPTAKGDVGYGFRVASVAEPGRHPAGH